MNKKVISYLGFAKKSGKLVSGVNTCTFSMAKGKVKLMLLSEDISENSEKKIMKEIRNIMCLMCSTETVLSFHTL